MHPLLFHVGSWPVHTYGFLIALGFVCAVQIIQYLAKKSSLDAERVQDLVFSTLVVGFIGARIVYVLTRFSFFTDHPAEILKVWEGGLVFYGGPLLAIPYVVWFAKRYRLPIWRLGDALLPGLTVAHAFGRLGCLAAGCCYGRPTGNDYGIILNSELVDPEFRGIHLHPTQLYESAALFVLFAALLLIFRRRKFEGQVMLTYFMAYPIIRSIVELYRGDTIRGFVIDGVLSTSQFISLLVFVVAFAVLIYRLREVRDE
ncbi:MAG: prolipoprotein diacylglyceryl transferase [Cryobacterium sp.]|nr:prolipoprotein diacylglyceryl transferase [Oligoflexia bacterium]